MEKILSNHKNTLLFFLVLSFIFYGNSIKNGFSLDDSYVTVTNYPVKGKAFIPNQPLVAEGIKSIPKIWRSHYGHGSGTSYDYRPLVISLFAIEYSLFGQAPHIDHAINVIVYGILVFYFFLFIRKCLDGYPYKESFALICSLLFLAHPLHSEVVNNIKCRDELIALLFILLAALQMLHYYEDRIKKRLVYFSLFVLIALFSKFTAAVFIVLIPLTLFFFSKISKKQLVYFALGSLACFILYRRSRRYLVPDKEIRIFYHFENPLYSENLSLIGKVLFALKTFGTYVKLLLFPYPLRFYYGSALIPTQVSFFDFDIIVGILFVFVAAYLCYRFKNKIAFFGLLFFLLSIAPLTNLVSPVAGILGERLVFTASIGFIILITALFFSLSNQIPAKFSKGIVFLQKPLIYVSGLLIISMFYIWNRNTAWDSEFSLYEHDAQYSEKSGGQNNLLANKYYEQLLNGDSKYDRQTLLEKCLKHYNLALTDDSTLYSAFNNAGAIYFSYFNQTDLALGYFKRAILNNPSPYPQAYENVGNCYKKKGDFIQSFKNYRIATMQNPYQYKSYTELMNLLIESKRLSAALPIIQEAAKNFPKDYIVTSQYANYYLLSGQMEMGMNKLEEAYQLSPNRKLAEYLYGKWFELKNTEKAEYYKNQYASLPQ